ncbi:transposase [Lysobacter firmicutimachus]|uniref:Transposase n=1 Tax=Lysobacter firmicutimachus TaxID=1792846 RepID=A0AAU8MXP7_9GAMM
MRKSRFTEAQIRSILGQADSGAAIRDLALQHGVSVPTLYNWRARYGGAESAEAARILQLQVENSELKRLCAEQTLEVRALKKIIARLPGRATLA